MAYDRLAERLADPPSPTTSTLPDGSVDYYCTLSAGAVEELPTRQAFGREILDHRRSSFGMRVETTEPGGQAVNAAKQLHALGSEVTCYGHLDHPVLASVPFETVSMGEPADVYAFNFRDGDVMFAERSADGEWSPADLRAVADLRDVFGADAVVAANWVSYPGLGDLFAGLADADVPRRPLVFDPGDVVGADPDRLAALRRGLARAQDAVDVVFDANRQEVRAVAATLPDTPADDPGRLAAIREATGIHAAVLHAEDVALAATRDGLVRVENRQVAHPERHTGGGDHFAGGLAFALGAGWDVELGLACANACAVHYVETGRAAGPAALRRYLGDHPSVG